MARSTRNRQVREVPKPPEQRLIQLGAERNVGDPISAHFIPWQMQLAREFMESMQSHSPFQVFALRQLATNPWAIAIIQTLVNRLTLFAKRRKDPYGLGYKLKLRNDEKTPSRAAMKRMDEIEDMLKYSGRINKPHMRFQRPSFAQFIQELMWDSYVLDAAAFEVVCEPDKSFQREVPVHWQAVDAGTIFKVAPKNVQGEYDEDDAQFCQVIEDQVHAWYRPGELCFGIRRSRTDMRGNGYGWPELAEMVQVLTGLMYGWTHNINYFRHGGPRGVVNVMGKIPEEQLEAFRTQMMFGASGVRNAFRMAVVNTPNEKGGIGFVPFGAPNKEMEFSEFMNSCFRLACSNFQVDPSEVGWYMQESGKGSVISHEASPEAKMKAGRDRSLRPGAMKLEYWLNEYIVQRLEPDFEIELLGLDAMSEKERADLDKALIDSGWLPNEVRAGRDQPPLEKGVGDVPWNAQAVQLHMAAQAQNEPGPEGGMGEDGAGGPEGPQDGAEEQEPQQAAAQDEQGAQGKPGPATSDEDWQGGPATSDEDWDTVERGLDGKPNWYW